MTIFFNQSRKTPLQKDGIKARLLRVILYLNQPDKARERGNLNLMEHVGRFGAARFGCSKKEKRHHFMTRMRLCFQCVSPYDITKFLDFVGYSHIKLQALMHFQSVLGNKNKSKTKFELSISSSFKRHTSPHWVPPESYMLLHPENPNQYQHDKTI